MTTATDVLAVASKELGVKEAPANSNNVKYNTWFYGREVRDTAKAKYPWCMAFVQWVFYRAGAKLPYVTASCSALLNWYKNNRPECVSYSPLPGDIVIYNFGHTGIVEKVGSGTITAIEGNTSSSNNGSQDNGGGVFRRVRRTSLVTAYIRPYAVAKNDKEDDDMDVARFKELWGEMRKELQDNDSSQWSEKARTWATSTGLIEGSGTLPNGEPNYSWADLLTREQFVTVLYRFANKMGMV